VRPSMGQFASEALSARRTPEQVADDEANRANRARSYEAYGAAVALCWQSAGLLMTFRPKLLGYAHGIALLVRSQRRFEEQMAATTTALGDILLYGSSETQEAAIALFRTLAEKLREIGSSGKQGSPEARTAYDAASQDVGDKVVTWRKCAQADLGMLPS
jgi:hypothetical protein